MMAKISNEMFQGVHGKVGQFVFRTVNGKTFLCKPPVFRKRKLTEKELLTRMKFAFIHQFLRPLKFLIHRTYRHPIEGKSGFNRAFSDNYHALMTGECPPFRVNFPKIVLSRGSLCLPDMIMAASLLPGTISFVWSSEHLFYQRDIKVFVAVYCGGWRFDIDNANMFDKMHTIDLPDFKGKPVHTYIGFISDNGHKVSDSCYTGMVNIL